MAEAARSVTAVDLNTVEIARRRVAHLNVTFIEADLGIMDLAVSLTQSYASVSSTTPITRQQHLTIFTVIASQAER